MNRRPISFGLTSKGEQTRLFTLTCGNVTATLTDFGATLVSFCINKNGQDIDVVLGCDDVTGYETGDSCFGATVGRSANRIDNACFTLNGTEYVLTDNDDGKNLHSGPDLWHKRIWDTDGVSDDGTSITFRLFSPDGDQGYPGNLDVSVTYTLDFEGGLAIHYHAESDKDTLFSPTNHSYFNLNGEGNGDILGHTLTLTAKQITPLNEKHVPYGAYMDTKDTPFDFRIPKALGADIESDHEQIRIGGGYDHNFVLADNKGRLNKVAELFGPETGIIMEVYTDLPGIQVYTGNYLKDAPGKGGKIYDKRCGVALETQFVPNSINVPEYAAPILRAGESFDSTTIYGLYILGM